MPEKSHKIPTPKDCILSKMRNFGMEMRRNVPDRHISGSN